MTTTVAVRLLRDLWPLRWRVLLASLLMFLCVAGSIGLMTTSGMLIALAATHPPVAALSVGVVGVRFFGLARGAMRYAERLVSHATGFRILARWRMHFFSRLEPLVPYGLGDQAEGELLARLGRDVDGLESLFARVISPILAAFWTAALMVLLLGSQGLPYVLCFLVCFLAAAWIPRLFLHRMSRAAQSLAEARGRLSAYAQSMLRGHAEIRVSGLEKRFQAEASTFERRQDQASLRLQQKMQLADALAGVFPGLVIVLFLILGAQDLAAGTLNPVYWVGIVLGVFAAFEAVQGFAGLAMQAEESLASGARLLALTERAAPVCEPRVGGGQPPGTGSFALRVRQLRVAFPGGVNLFQLDFELEAGDVLILRGASGSGKSTLAAVLVRFLEYQGSVELFGRELRNLPGAQVRREVCLLDQDVHLFTGTLSENMRIASDHASDEEILNVLEAVGLKEWLDSLPQGLETWLGERGQALSGGERQRIAAARALLCKAPFVVADEPAAHLHAEAEYALLNAFRNAAHRPALLWISHRLEDRSGFRELWIK